MDHQAFAQLLGNYGEFVGAFGVIISLVYLGIQVRGNSRLVQENTKAHQMAAELASNDGTRAMGLELVKSPELTDLIRRGAADGEDLNRIDHQRFEHWVTMTLESHMTFFIQYRRGLAGNEVWDYWTRFFDRLFRQPGVALVWQRTRNNYDEDFRAYMDAKIQSG